jgi:galactonate dehydratase
LLQVHTDEGISGLGETFFGAETVESYVHETLAPLVLGRDPLHIDRLGQAVAGYVGRRGSGAEVRARSALDIALWDVFGKATGQPIYQLLGGPFRDAIKVYNTCAGYQYVRSLSEQTQRNWGLTSPPSGPYEDLRAFLSTADELAQSLLEEGFSGMKSTNGTYITTVDLRKSLEPFRKIRDAVADNIEIMVEMHQLWQPAPARRIASALEEFAPMWIEDPVANDPPELLATVARSTTSPVAAGETLAGKVSFRSLLERGAMSVAIVDLGWCGGISEAKKIATLAEAHGTSIAPHDCTGPVVLTASTHLAVNAPTAIIQEIVRAFYSSWYAELVTELPPIRNGRISPPPGPGLGTQLQPDLRQRRGTSVRTTPADEI